MKTPTATRLILAAFATALVASPLAAAAPLAGVAFGKTGVSVAAPMAGSFDIARRGADDAAGDDRGGARGGKGRGADDAPGDDRGGARGGKGRGADDAPGDDRGGNRGGKGRGADDAPNHG